MEEICHHSASQGIQITIHPPKQGDGRFPPSTAPPTAQNVPSTVLLLRFRLQEQVHGARGAVDI